MSYTVLSITVACEKTQPAVDPRYRVFVDDVLLVERVFWPTVPLYWIEERLTFEDDGQQHSGRVETVDPAQGTIQIVSLQCSDGDSDQQLPKQNAWLDTDDSNKFTFSLDRR